MEMPDAASKAMATDWLYFHHQTEAIDLGFKIIRNIFQLAASVK